MYNVIGPVLIHFYSVSSELWKERHGHIISQDESFLPVCEWHTGGRGAGGYGGIERGGVPHLE